MPEIHGNGRFNAENKFGDVIVSPRKTQGKPHIKGCPGNGGNEHFYVATKIISIYKETNRVYVYKRAFCLFCEKRYTYRGSSKKVETFEVLETVVKVFGSRVPHKPSHIYVNATTYTGNTDNKGKEI